MDADQLKRQTFEFGIRCINLSRALPKTIEGKAVAGQFVRAGTSVGANYRAACKARSRAEFVAKIGTVEEETDESCYWMEVIIASQMMPASRVQSLLDEGRELEKIFGQSRITAASKLRVKQSQTPNQSAIGNRQ